MNRPYRFNYMSYKNLYSTTNPQDVAFLESMFQAQDIDYVVENKFSGFGMYAGGMTIKVNVKDVEQATELIKQYEEDQQRDS